MRLFCFILVLLLSQVVFCQSVTVVSDTTISHRQIVTNPDFANLNSNYNCSIYLKANVSQTGEIIGNLTVVRSKTTTDDMVLINQVIEIIRKEVVFSTGVLEDETIELKVYIKKSSI